MDDGSLAYTMCVCVCVCLWCRFQSIHCVQMRRECTSVLYQSCTTIRADLSTRRPFIFFKWSAAVTTLLPFLVTFLVLHEPLMNGALGAISMKRKRYLRERDGGRILCVMEGSAGWKSNRVQMGSNEALWTVTETPCATLHHEFLSECEVEKIIIFLFLTPGPIRAAFAPWPPIAQRRHSYSDASSIHYSILISQSTTQ